MRQFVGARYARPAMDSGETAKLVCFYLQNQEYAADIREIKETLVMRPITRVFLTPPWLSGIINLRGDVVAVLDLAQLLGLPPALITDDSRIIVARYEKKKARAKLVGLIADQLGELRDIELESLEPPPATLAEQTLELLRGIATVEGGKALRVLDIATLFESERLNTFRRTTERRD